MVNDTVKRKFSHIILSVYLSPCIKTGKLVFLISVSRITIIRDIKLLSHLVFYKGASKTGGYFLDDAIKTRLDNVERD